MSRLILALFFFFLSLSLFANPPKKFTRVIYITFDGTRWQDVFNDHQFFQKFWDKYASETTLYGAPDSNTKMEVASIPTSLPSYQSQMAGSVQPCNSNSCGRIQVETVAENLVHKLGLQQKDVAVFASWWEIGLASEHVIGTIYNNTGNTPVYDPDTHEADAVMYDLNQQQTVDQPDNLNRYDKYTFAQAMHYMEKYKPRFMWISLVESDDRAHEGNLEKYQEALRYYDDVLEKIFTTLKTLKIEKETLMIVTTDHGRGNGDHWTDHGVEFPESKQTWAMVMNGEMIPVEVDGPTTYFSTLSIRPTIEAALLP